MGHLVIELKLVEAGAKPGFRVTICGCRKSLELFAILGGMQTRVPAGKGSLSIFGSLRNRHTQPFSYRAVTVISLLLMPASRLISLSSHSTSFLSRMFRPRVSFFPLVRFISMS